MRLTKGDAWRMLLWVAVFLPLALMLSGCGRANVEINGTGSWSLFQQRGTVEGSGSTTIEVDRGQRVTVQLLNDGNLRVRVTSEHEQTPWRQLNAPLDAVEFYVK